jgi:hypothetical protein
MFKSRTIVEHILRGVLGFGMLAIALTYAAQLGWWTAVPLVGALVSFRGCPTCWTMGFVETILHRRAQGSCPLPGKSS